MTNTPLSEVAIHKIVQGMPGGLEGFCAGWGWLQFARKIEAAHGITHQTTMTTQPTIKAGQRLLLNLPSSGLTEIRVIEINGAFVKAEVSNEMRWERIERVQSMIVHVLEEPAEPKPRQSMADAVREASKPQPTSLNSMFTTFGWQLFMAITNRVADGQCDEWCEDAMEKAVSIGLARKERYNPSVHGDMEADAGDAIWTWNHLPAAGWNKAVEFIDPSTGEPQPDLSKRGVLHLQPEYGPRHSTYIDGFPNTACFQSPEQRLETIAVSFPLPDSDFQIGKDTFTK